MSVAPFEGLRLALAPALAPHPWGSHPVTVSPSGDICKSNIYTRISVTLITTGTLKDACRRHY